MAQEIEFFQSYLISDLYLIYILNDFKKSNVCRFCYNSFLYKETVKHFIRAATSTDFRNRLTGPPNSNRIRLT